MPRKASKRSAEPGQAAAGSPGPVEQPEETVSQAAGRQELADKGPLQAGAGWQSRKRKAARSLDEEEEQQEQQAENVQPGPTDREPPLEAGEAMAGEATEVSWMR